MRRFLDLTDESYESKIVYRTEKFQDLVRTFCMNPKGAVVNENTNGIVTVNGHSYEDPVMHTGNTNFALLVAKHFSYPFKDSNGYGESIARLSKTPAAGVMSSASATWFGCRVNGTRIEESFTTPTLAATPGDLSLVMPKRILDGIIEMIYALDKIAPGTANDDTLLYGVEVKFYRWKSPSIPTWRPASRACMSLVTAAASHPLSLPRLRQRRLCRPEDPGGQNAERAPRQTKQSKQKTRKQPHRRFRVCLFLLCPQTMQV